MPRRRKKRSRSVMSSQMRWRLSPSTRRRVPSSWRCSIGYRSLSRRPRRSFGRSSVVTKAMAGCAPSWCPTAARDAANVSLNAASLALAAFNDTLAASLAAVGHHDGAHPAIAFVTTLERPKDRRGLRESERYPIEHLHELGTRRLVDGESRHLICEDITERDLFFRRRGIHHLGPDGGFEVFEFGEQCQPGRRVGDIPVRCSSQHRADVLSGVGKGRVRARDDAVHALGALVGEPDRSFPPCLLYPSAAADA